MSASAAFSAELTRGIAAAGQALGRLSGGRVSVAAPAVDVARPADLMAHIGSAERHVVGVYVGFDGAISGHALLLMTPDGAARIAGHLIAGLGGMDEASQEELANDKLDVLRRSALEELGNVVISSVLNEVGRSVDRAIHPSVPQAVTEMAGAILDTVLADLVVDSDELTVARAEFTEAGDSFDGWLLILPRDAGDTVVADPSTSAA